MLKSILRIKNTYKLNGSVITKGVISLNQKSDKSVIYFFLIVLKVNENKK